MRSFTFICRACGSMRRRGYVSREGAVVPTCHDRKMEWLTSPQAAGAAKLRKSDRLTWLAHGKRVVRRHGGRWGPALTDRQTARADEQYGHASWTVDRRR